MYTPSLNVLHIPSPEENNFIFLPLDVHSEKERKPTPVTALIDSGAQENFVNEMYAQKHQFPLKLLKNPIRLRYADGSSNSEATVKYYTNLQATIDGRKCLIPTLITRLAAKDIILGIPFLSSQNPDIDWKTRTFKWRDEEPSTLAQLMHSMILPADIASTALNYVAAIETGELDEDGWLDDPSSYHSEPVSWDEFDLADEINHTFLEINYKASTSTHLAQKDKPKAFQLPEKWKKYSKLFDQKASNRFPPSRPCDHRIDLKEGFIPKKHKAYRLTQTENDEVRKFLDENLHKGYIRPSDSPMASPLFFVGKKDGKLRPCQDYKYLNDGTIKNAYPLPLISEILDKLKNARYFTKLDIRQGYNNVRIREGDQWKAAFSTPFGHFEPMVMFFGLTNSPATFQNMMNDIFRDMIDQSQIVVYMDDILAFAPSISELDQITEKVLQRLEREDLYLKGEKCEFGVQRLEYLGYIINPGKVEMDPTKLAGISEWPVPKTTREVRKFLGFANYYRKFIRNYADIARPLNRLLSKNVTFEWGAEAMAAFENLKNQFSKKPVLSTPDLSKQFEVECDASKYASGAVLSQKDSNGTRHPIMFFSKSFSDAERRYDIHDRELLAIKRAFDEWRHYLEGARHQVLVRSDHRNLTFWKKPQKVNHRQARWYEFLTRFDFIIEHVPGEKIPAADALSRRPDHIPKGGSEEEHLTMLNGDKFVGEITMLGQEKFVNIIDAEFQTEITKAMGRDSVISETVEDVMRNRPELIKERYSLYDTDSGALLLKDGHVVIPDNIDLRRRMVQRYHDHPTSGHPGEQETYRRMKQDVYWPGMSTFVRNYVKGCATCQQNKINRHPSHPPLKPIDPPLSIRPFSQIAMDLITDLPPSKNAANEICDTILSVVDHGLSKGAIFIPTTKSATAQTIANLLMNHLFPKYGLPDKIISDRDPRFTAKTTKAFFKQLNIEQAMSTAFHPQSDGTTERFNQEIAAYLSIYCSNNPSEWTKHVPLLEFAHNSRIHSDRQKSPFELIMGINPKGIPSIIETPSVHSSEQRLRELDQARNEAIAAHKLAQERMKQRIKSTFKPFREGQQVWLDSRNLKLSYPSRKIAPKREGPFKIKRVLSPLTYELTLPSKWKIHPIFHAVLLSPYNETEVHGPNIRSPSPEFIGDEVEHEVEGVLKHRIRDNQLEFLVKWKGFDHDENEWMTEEVLAPHALAVLNDYRKGHQLAPFDKEWMITSRSIKIRPNRR